jgi:hypothetical protein
MITTLGAGATIEDVRFSGVSARSEQGIVINASEGATVRNITVTDMRLKLSLGAMSAFSGGTLDLRPLSMERRPLPAILANRVRGLSLRNVSVTIEEEARRLFPDVAELRACPGMDIQGLREIFEDRGDRA